MAFAIVTSFVIGGLPVGQAVGEEVEDAVGEQILTDTLIAVKPVVSGGDYQQTSHSIDKVNPENGDVRTVGGAPWATDLTDDESAFDRDGHRYFYRNGGHLGVFDASTGDRLQGLRGVLRNFEYDSTGDMLVGTAVQGDGYYQVATIGLSGTHSFVAAFPDGAAPIAGLHAYDDVGQRYFSFASFASGGLALLTFDVEAGALVSQLEMKPLQMPEYDPVQDRIIGWQQVRGGGNLVALDPGTGDTEHILFIERAYLISQGGRTMDTVTQRYFAHVYVDRAERLLTIDIPRAAITYDVAVSGIDDIEHDGDVQEVICRDIPRIVETIRVPVADAVGLLGQVIPMPDQVKRVVTQVGFKCEPTSGGPGTPGRPCGELILDDPTVGLRVRLLAEPKVDVENHTVRVSVCLNVYTPHLNVNYVDVRANLVFDVEDGCDFRITPRYDLADERYHERWRATC